MVRRVRLMSDYACGYPLWAGDGLLHEDFGPEHGLSPALQRRLLALQAHFEERFGWDTGWRGAGDEARYAAEAVDLFHRLGRELGDGWEVTLDLWPVDDETILEPLRRQGIVAEAPTRRQELRAQKRARRADEAADRRRARRR